MQGGRRRGLLNRMDELKKGSKMDNGVRLVHAGMNGVPRSCRPLVDATEQPLRNGKVKKGKRGRRRRSRRKKRARQTVVVEEDKEKEKEEMQNGKEEEEEEEERKR